MKHKIVNGLSMVVLLHLYLFEILLVYIEFLDLDHRRSLAISSMLMVAFYLVNPTIRQLKILLLFILSIGLIYLGSGAGQYATIVASLISVPLLLLTYLQLKRSPVSQDE